MLQATTFKNDVHFRFVIDAHLEGRRLRTPVDLTSWLFSRFTEAQITNALCQAEIGTSVPEVIRKVGISE